jgi:hypothetical protein
VVVRHILAHRIVATDCLKPKVLAAKRTGVAVVMVVAVMGVLVMVVLRGGERRTLVGDTQTHVES